MVCREVEQHFAAYVEGTPGSESGAVESHLQRCPPCRARLAAERAAHELLRTRRDRLRCQAPDTLRHRCAAQRQVSRPPRSAVRRTLLPLSLAATLVLATAVLLLFGIGSTVETYAAQLAADHLKCFQFPPDAAPMDAAVAGRNWEARNGWPLKVAASTRAEELELIGVRRCGSTHGRVAHLLYRWHGVPLSVYVLNRSLDDDPGDGTAAQHSVYKLGEHAIVWFDRGRTYAVVAQRRVPDLEQVTGYLRHAVE
jgi:anti-sigma factor RsiW